MGRSGQVCLKLPSTSRRAIRSIANWSPSSHHVSPIFQYSISYIAICIYAFFTTTGGVNVTWFLLIFVLFWECVKHPEQVAHPADSREETRCGCRSVTHFTSESCRVQIAETDFTSESCVGAVMQWWGVQEGAWLLHRKLEIIKEEEKQKATITNQKTACRQWKSKLAEEDVGETAA